MDDAETSITLVGARLAKPGLELIFRGPTTECDNCKLKNTCMNLDVGRRYKIVKIIKETLHDCPIHDSGVVAVEVAMAPVKAAIESRIAFPKSQIAFEPPRCDHVDCSMYDMCHPVGIRWGDRCTITKDLGDVHEKCEIGKHLKVVELKL